MKKFTILALALLFVAPMAMADNHEGAQKNIVQTAIDADGFNTLVAAVQAAELVDVLAGDGPFTVFAPTDEAFAQIPEKKLQALLADKDALTAVLTYHVVAGKVTAEDVSKLDRAETVNGEEVKIVANKNKVQINNAKVITADIMASNGVIHVIDKVLLPKDMK